MTSRPDLKTFDARLEQAMRSQASRFTEALTPFLLEMSQHMAHDRNAFEMLYTSTTKNVACGISGMVASAAMNIAQDRALGTTLAPLLIAAVDQITKDYLKDLASGLQSPVKVLNFDIATGQPMPFDFRDHIKRDSGRASEVGQ